MPVRAAGGSHRSAYTPAFSRYPTHPGISRGLDHSSSSQSCNHPWFALPQEAFVCREQVKRRRAIQKRYTPLHTPHIFQILGDSTCFIEERLDPSAVNHLSSQCLNGGGETTGLEFHFKFGLPRPEIKPVIDSFWISYPENLGSALDGCSTLSLCEQ